MDFHQSQKIFIENLKYKRPFMELTHWPCGTLPKDQKKVTTNKLIVLEK